MSAASTPLLSELGERELRQRLACGDLVLRAGPFHYRIKTRLGLIVDGLRMLYADYPVADPQTFADFSLHLHEGSGLHRWWRRQVRFESDGLYPFEPLPLSHALAQLEWTMNWCVSEHANNWLMLHAAVVEKNGFAAILPAPPGSGKSTLCAGLTSRGWRLLTDEMALISLQGPQPGLLWPAARPISLKNESVAVMREFAPDAVIGPLIHGTAKGSVTHMRVPAAHVARMDEPAQPRWVVLPKYVAGAPAVLEPLSRGRAMLDLGANSFNYTLLGLAGFEALAGVVERCEAFSFSYSRLDEAVAVFDALAAAALGQQQQEQERAHA